MDYKDMTILWHQTWSYWVMLHQSQLMLRCIVRWLGLWCIWKTWDQKFALLWTPWASSWQIREMFTWLLQSIFWGSTMWWWSRLDDDPDVMMIQTWWRSRSSDDPDVMMIQTWWWSRSSDDPDVMMIQTWWWSISSDDLDVMMIQQWWYRCNDDPVVMI